jgi:hypothetical protein
VEVAGLADSSGYIDEFIDVSTEAVNEVLTSQWDVQLVGPQDTERHGPLR